jgi:hypothetical protein
MVHRKAMPSSAMSAGMPAAPKRKPLPGTLAPATDFNNMQNINAANYSQRSPGMLSSDYNARRSEDSIRYQGENDRSIPLPRRPSEQASSADVSLTLIRRDPASSAQWNVASIKDSSVLEVSSSTLGTSETKKRTGAPVYIEITNPGYSKFLNMSQDGVMPYLASRNSDLSVRSNYPGYSPQAPIPVASGNTQMEEQENVFRRRLWLEGTKYSKSSFGHRKTHSNELSIGRQTPRSSLESHQREKSSVDLRTPGAPTLLSPDDRTYSTIQVSEKQSSFRGYVFMSPWNGRCEFITGAGGGSLKVSHRNLYELHALC